MKANGTFGVLMLICSITGNAIDTGVRYRAADLARTISARVRMRCPHCRKTHVFDFADATLRPLACGENPA